MIELDIVTTGYMEKKKIRNKQIRVAFPTNKFFMYHSFPSLYIGAFQRIVLQGTVLHIILHFKYLKTLLIYEHVPYIAHNQTWMHVALS